MDFAIFAMLVKLAAWPWFIAGTVSFIAATLVNYVLSVRHVFTSGARFEKRQEIALTFLVSAIGLAINQLVLLLLIRQGISVLLAKIGGTATVFLWNYFARQYFIFRDTPRSARH